MPWPRENPEASTRQAPAKRTKPRSNCGLPACLLKRCQSQGATINPPEEATANTAMALAPEAAPLVRLATNRADCSRPQGQATHSAPAPAARTGPRIGVQPGVPATCAVCGWRTTAPIQFGCRPTTTIHRPKVKKSTCNSTHKGRKAGVHCDSAASALTLLATTAPAAA